MMIRLTITLFFFHAILLSQNLVNNPDFKYTHKELSNNINVLEGWRGFGTVDYYHANNIKFFPWYSVPNNWSGFVQPKCGDSYLGFILLADGGGFELVQGELVKPLEKNKLYKIDFWIKIANKNCAARNLGIYFSNDSIFFECMNSKLGFRFINYINCYDTTKIAHISTPENLFLTDTTWFNINGTYTAKGGEKYFTIGLFWQDNIKVVESYNKAKKPVKNIKNKSIRKHNRYIRKFYLTLSSYILVKNPNLKKIKTDNLIDQKHNGAYYFIDCISVTPLNSNE